jgi:hypothetical protein
MPGRLIIHEKWVTNEGDLVEIKVWAVERSESFAEGVKYSMVLIHNGQRVLGYDNERGKGHHEHWFGKETLFEFKDLGHLLRKFERSVDAIRGELYGNAR